MTNPSMYETVENEQEEEVLTLETVNGKCNALFEAMNHMYEVLVKGVKDEFMRSHEESVNKEKIVAQGFHTVNAALSALSAKIDTIVEHLVDTGMNKETFEAKAVARAQELLKMQEEAIQRFIADQEKRAAEARVASEAKVLTEVQG